MNNKKVKALEELAGNIMELCNENKALIEEVERQNLATAHLTYDIDGNDTIYISLATSYTVYKTNFTSTSPIDVDNNIIKILINIFDKNKVQVFADIEKDSITYINEQLSFKKRNNITIEKLREVIINV